MHRMITSDRVRHLRFPKINFLAQLNLAIHFNGLVASQNKVINRVTSLPSLQISQVSIWIALMSCYLRRSWLLRSFTRGRICQTSQSFLKPKLPSKQSTIVDRRLHSDEDSTITEVWPHSKRRKRSWSTNSLSDPSKTISKTKRKRMQHKL